MELPDYKSGWHRKWEVYLHYIRWQARQTKSELLPAVEEKMMTAWLSVNRITADDPAPCTICQDEIADGLLTGHDPFKMPAAIKAAFKQLAQRLTWRSIQ